jgi:salicylate hydroxylase
MPALRIIVVGAGIGGLAAAVGLRKAGHDVTVVEQASTITEVGAGLGLGPNATGALFTLGLRNQLEGSAVAPVAATRRRWKDGSHLFRGDLTDLPDRVGYPFWFAHRGDLQTALRSTAADPELPGTPVRLMLDTRCEGVDPDATTVLTSAGHLAADVVIGADGIRSRVRQALFGPDEPRYTGNTAFRTQVSTADALAQPLLRPFVEDNAFESWLGPDGHVVHAPFRGGKQLNVTACMEADPIGPGVSSAPSSQAELLATLDGWYEPLRHLVEIGGPVTRYDIYDLAPLDHWSAGRVCLMGDSAHPMMPYLGQGAAQALEDAEYLHRVFRDVDRDGIDDALAEFELVRRPRATRVQEVARANRTVFHMPDGPAQQARDREIARGATDSDVFRWLWRFDPTERATTGAAH